MLVVWRLFDGKPGHDRQSVGLVQALGAITPIESIPFDVCHQHASCAQFLTRQLGFGQDAPDPDLIVGAGRRCQWPMLASKRARGGNTIYLMKPQLPRRCFDLCLIPRHDQATTTARSIITDGVLNDISPSEPKSNHGLLLIGGPSDHYGWDLDQLINQLRAILDGDGTKKWTIADSRRTPAATSAALQGLARDNVSVIGYRESAPDVLPAALAQADIVWASCDSVSMIYEAISAGAAVGVLNVPAQRRDRITAIIGDLVARNMVTTFADWRNGGELHTGELLAEATRCARMILARWDPSSRRLRSEPVP